MLAQWMLDSNATCFLILVTLLSLMLVWVSLITLWQERPWDKIEAAIEKLWFRLLMDRKEYSEHVGQRLRALEAKIDRLTETMGVNMDDTEA